MMHLPRFLKKNNFFIFIIYSLSVVCIGQDKPKNDNALILEIAMRTENSYNLWVLHYIIIQNRVYSGDIFHGGNTTCLSQENKVDTSINCLIANEELILLENKIQKFNYKKFVSGFPFIDTNFYWKSFSVPIEYYELACSVETPDFFKFLFTYKYNGICINRVRIKKLRKDKFPNNLYEQILANNVCLRRLQISYNEFEKCLNNK